MLAASTSGKPLPGGTLEVRVHARKGRTVHTTRLVKAGEIVLVEAPTLLLVSPDLSHTTCATCLRAVDPTASLACAGCQRACFCSAACQQAAHATPWLHSPPICSAYARLAALGLPADEHAQLRFLLHALALRHTQSPEAAARYAALMDLVGQPGEADRALAARFAPLLAEALSGAGVPPPALEVEEMATLLVKEQLNSYGVLASPQQQQRQQQQAVAAAVAGPASAAQKAEAGTSGKAAADGDEQDEEDEEEEEERMLRGSAIYSQAALINHECLPNVARYDYFDCPPPHDAPSWAGLAPTSASTCTSGAASAPTGGASAGGGGAPGGGASALPLPAGVPGPTHVVFRAVHDLPPGTELAQSYVPLHWGLLERQLQCREVYGFACTCPRCQTESQWSDEDEDSDDEDDVEEQEEAAGAGAEDMEEDGDGVAAAAAAGASAADGDELEMEELLRPITAPPGEEGPLESNYLHLFLLKYMCPRRGCHGTAAPPAPGSGLLECNVCGGSRSEQEFLRELERTRREEQRAAAAAAAARAGGRAGRR
ncbi:hypothetical protein HXX76_011264 [Chlamydomonas incerta]|uniref:SET domain-containing protein n=1 Tax=Chlamydomonas incerta TaxID=51695 RepID=A0A835SKU4_CHLIN|nr:hypothetical protein HXX76_011264 [Chlamydomonas incerta]|eukprot:KAG2429022.1 hypothetical protein HXX76_011264 [Chlamydomonas incerta]